MTGAYGWTVGKVLRRHVVVLLVYAGLLVLTYWIFQSAPTGFIPQQDQGRLIVNIQLPDCGIARADQGSSGKIVADRPGNTGRGAHGRHFRAVIPASGQQPQLRFDVHRPGSLREAATIPKLRDTAIMARLRRDGAGRSDAAVTVYGASPIPGVGRRGRIQVHHRGSRRPRLEALQQQTENVVTSFKLGRTLRRRHPVPVQHAAALSGHRSHQGASARAFRSTKSIRP